MNRKENIKKLVKDFKLQEDSLEDLEDKQVEMLLKMSLIKRRKGLTVE